MDAEKKIRVSIVVPMYNRKATIGRCLESLINQTLQDIEIVVVDDGSSDQGGEVVLEYQKRDERIRLITQENQGLGAARNVGIRACRGTYIGFMDSDDYADLQMYEKMLEAALSEDVEIAVCQEKNVYFDEDGQMKVLGETKFPCSSPTVYERKQMLDWFLNYTYLSLNSACFKLVKRTVFTEKGVWFPEKHRYAEDLPTSAGMFSAVEKIVLVPESLYCYIHEMGTLSTNYTVKKAQDVYQDMLDAMHYMKKAGYQGRIDNFVLGMSFSSLRQLYGTADKAERKSKESRILLQKWKKAKRKVKPVFRGMEVPLFHKIKVLVAWFRLEAFMCWVIRLLGHIPFFKYMV